MNDQSTNTTSMDSQRPLTGGTGAGAAARVSGSGKTEVLRMWMGRCAIPGAQIVQPVLFSDVLTSKLGASQI